MSLDRCLPGLVADGKLTAEQADNARGLFEQLRQDFRRQFGDQTADAMATDAALKALAAETLRKRRLAGLTIKARQQMEADLRGGGADGGGGGGGDGPAGPIDPERGPSFFTRRDGVGHFNVEGRRQAIQRRAFGMIGSILQRFHTDLAGRLRHAAELPDVVREILQPGSTGKIAARELAEAWAQAAEMLRLRFNAAGGAIGRLSDGRGYLPQSHDALKVRAAGYRAWRAEIWDRLDRAQMIDERTGRPFSDEALELALQDVFETIRTDGWFKRLPGGQGKGATANRRADPRFLIFKSADDWMAYNDQFGTGTAFDAMVSHIRGMARDIAAMERFGPNPEAGVQWLRETMEKSAALADDKGEALKAVAPALDRMDALWAEFTGSGGRPSREWLANAGRFTRAWEVASKMGSAIIPAVPGDLGTQRVAAKFNALPLTRVIGNQIKLLDPTNGEHRLLAAEMGLAFDGWISHVAAQQRALGDELAAGAMGRVAEGVLRAQGLGVWTNAGQAAFGMTVLGHMARMRGRAWGQLDDGFRDMMTRHGLTGAEWDRIRATPAREARGQKWIFAQDIADTELGDKVLAMLANEQNLAVQQADFETRAVMHANIRKGTAIGEVTQSALLFKSFGISMLLNHGRRIMAMTDWRSRASYAVNLGITMTLAGAVAIQLREIAKGRDPRPMDTPEFWAAAALQGGGFGMVGDLLDAAVDPRQGSWAMWLAGPVASTIENVGSLAVEGVTQAAGGAGNAGRALVKTLQAEMPGGNLWYARLAYQRLLLDQLSMLVDPNYGRSWRAMERRADDEGSGFFWRPGATAPARAPDLSNAVEGSTQP